MSSSVIGCLAGCATRPTDIASANATAGTVLTVAYHPRRCFSSAVVGIRLDRALDHGENGSSAFRCFNMCVVYLSDSLAQSQPSSPRALTAFTETTLPAAS